MYSLWLGWAGSERAPVRGWDCMLNRRVAAVQRRSPGELALMARAGEIAAAALARALEAIEPGVSTSTIDRIAEQTIREAGAVPSFLGFNGYPASTCISVNDVVVHGIPSDDIRIEEGDIVGVDVGAIYKRYHGDNAATKAVGEVPAEALRLMQVTSECLALAVEQAQAGNLLKAISSAVQEHAEGAGYSVVRQLLGHGIGRQMHEPPQVPNYYSAGEFAEYELTLRPGMVLAIEPMINAGGPAVKVDADGWTTRTADGSLSAHFEHTVAVTKNGPRVMTPRS